MTLQHLRDNFNVLVIPCSSSKLEYPAKAEEFYCGKGYFLHQLRIAKVSGLPWFILSTKYGLIAPDYICEPYSLIWSKKVQQDNCSMRGKDIPIATEQQRIDISTNARVALSGEKVLSFCSLHYKSYFPGWHFFNEEIAKSQPQNKKGIQFLVKTLNRLYLESL